MNLQTALGCIKVLTTETEKRRKPESLPGLNMARIYLLLRVFPQALCVGRRLLALDRKAPKLIVRAAREADFLTKQKSFLFCPTRRSRSGYKCLTLIRKTPLVSSLEVNAPVVLAGGWGLQKANSSLVSEHSSGVRDWFPLDLCQLVSKVVLSSPCCLWDHSFS